MRRSVRSKRPPVKVAALAAETGEADCLYVFERYANHVLAGIGLQKPCRDRQELWTQVQGEVVLFLWTKARLNASYCVQGIFCTQKPASELIKRGVECENQKASRRACLAADLILFSFPVGAFIGTTAIAILNISIHAIL
jgi:hypothetical protein